MPREVETINTTASRAKIPAGFSFSLIFTVKNPLNIYMRNHVVTQNENMRCIAILF